MTQFNDREEAFEKKFAHDQEIDFLVAARACKLLGLWAAAEMKLSGSAADAYAHDIATVNVDAAGPAAVRRKIHADLAAKGHDVSDHVLDRQLEKFTAEARLQIMNDTK